MTDEITYEVPNSKSIQCIVHNGEVLRVFYSSGAIFDYDDVSDQLVAGLVHAEQPARYMVDQIMPDRKGRPASKGDPLPSSS